MEEHEFMRRNDILIKTMLSSGSDFGPALENTKKLCVCMCVSICTVHENFQTFINL